MSSSSFGIEAVSINGSTYSGVRGQSRNTDRTIMSEGSDGTVFETVHSIVKSAAVYEWDTVACKAMLTALGTSGTAQFPFVALNGSTGLVMYCGRSASLAPGYDSTAIHVSRTVLNGVVVMERMSWGGVGQVASMHMKAYGTSTNGTTDPLTISTTVTAGSLPSPTNTEQLVLTALTLNGSSLGPVQNVELTVDHKCDYDYLAGNPFPTNTRMAGPNGRAAIRLSAEVNAMDLAEGTGSVSAVFTTTANGGTLGSHSITWTFNGPWALADSESGGNSGPMSQRFTVRPFYNGSTFPLTWATT